MKNTKMREYSKFQYSNINLGIMNVSLQNFQNFRCFSLICLASTKTTPYPIAPPPPPYKKIQIRMFYLG